MIGKNRQPNSAAWPAQGTDKHRLASTTHSQPLHRITAAGHATDSSTAFVYFRERARGREDIRTYAAELGLRYFIVWVLRLRLCLVCYSVARRI